MGVESLGEGCSPGSAPFRRKWPWRTVVGQGRHQSCGHPLPPPTLLSPAGSFYWPSPSRNQGGRGLVRLLQAQALEAGQGVGLECSGGPVTASV